MQMHKSAFRNSIPNSIEFEFFYSNVDESPQTIQKKTGQVLLIRPSHTHTHKSVASVIRATDVCTNTLIEQFKPYVSVLGAMRNVNLERSL